MGRSFWEPVVRRVLIVQVASVALLTVVALVSSGQLAAISALAGGGTVVVGSLVYAFIVRPAEVFAVSGRRVLLRHIVAELAKLSLVLGLLFGAFATRSFDGGWLLAGFILVLLAYWAAIFPTGRLS
jgi:F0F1-type ATP synthase assembly protein I